MKRKDFQSSKYNIRDIRIWQLTCKRSKESFLLKTDSGGDIIGIRCNYRTNDNSFPQRKGSNKYFCEITGNVCDEELLKFMDIPKREKD